MMKTKKIILSDKIHWNSPDTIPTDRQVLYACVCRPNWCNTLKMKRKHPVKQVVTNSFYVDGRYYFGHKKIDILGWCEYNSTNHRIVSEFYKCSNLYKRNNQGIGYAHPDNPSIYGDIKKEEDCYNTSSYYDTRVRVPSLKRSNSEWRNFYKLFPSLYYAMKNGQTHINGARLKDITI